MSDPLNNTANKEAGSRRKGKPKRLLIPNADGTLEVKELTPDIRHLSEAKVEHLKRRSPQVKDKRVVRAGHDLNARALKAADIVVFNMKAEDFFIHWLGEKIRGTMGQGVDVAWVFPNAAFELDISTETAKRYLAKHTADRAEFLCSDGRVFFRDV